MLTISIWGKLAMASSKKNRLEPRQPYCWLDIIVGIIWLFFMIIHEDLSREQSGCFHVILATAWALPVPVLWKKGQENDDQKQRHEYYKQVVIRLAILALILGLMLT